MGILRRIMRKLDKSHQHKHDVGDLVTVDLTRQMPAGPVPAVVRYRYEVGYLVEFKAKDGSPAFAWTCDEAIIDTKKSDEEAKPADSAAPSAN